MTEFTAGNKMLQQEHRCIICGKKGNLEPHHILHVNHHDELYNSMENVVVMCHDCHHSYHQLHNHELGFKSLLKFKGKYWKDDCKKLKKENKLLRKTIRELRKVK